MIACLLVGTACSAGSVPATEAPPSETAFTAGTCRAVAPDVLSIGRDAQRLGPGPEVDKALLDSLADAQTRLRALADTAEPTYKPALEKLSVAVGLVRLQARVGSYRPAEGNNLRTSYAAVLKVCT